MMIHIGQHCFNVLSLVPFLERDSLERHSEQPQSSSFLSYYMYGIFVVGNLTNVMYPGNSGTFAV